MMPTRRRADASAGHRGDARVDEDPGGKAGTATDDPYGELEGGRP